MMVTSLDIILFITYFFLMFLSIFWLIVLFAGEKEEEKKKLSEFPFFTVIVPAYNEEDSIIGTLDSLINLDYPSEKIEIIVVNDGSIDKTRELVEGFMLHHSSSNIKLINQKNQGKAKAMNEALKIAKGKFFASLDADSFVGSNALQKMLPYFDNNDVAAVCPLLKVKKPKNVLQKVQWCEYTINMFYKFLNARLDCIHVTPGPFSVYRTAVVNQLGGYDETTITEDLEIAIRLQKHHYKIMQTFDAVVETIAPSNWRALFKQRVRWYKGSLDNSFKYKKLMFNKEYGDFGYLRMPTIIISGSIAIILTTLLLKEALVHLMDWYYSLKAVNFDILTLIMNFDPNFNFLSLPFFKMFLSLTLLSISFFVMVHSYKLVREKITNHGKTWVSLITYLVIYSIFLALVWLYIAFIFVSKKKNSWT